MRHSLCRVLDVVIAGEPFLLAFAIPVLLFPQGYLWQWRHGLIHYAPIEEPGLRYPGLLSWVALGLVALPWISRWVRHGSPTRRTPLDVPIAVYVVTALLSLWPSVDRAHSMNFLLLIVAGVAVYYGVVNAVHNQRRLQLATALFLLIGFGLTAVGFLQTDWAHFSGKVIDLSTIYGWLDGLPGPFGREVNVGITASATLLFIPLGISLVSVAGRWYLRIAFVLAIVLVVGLPLLAQSRGDVLALVLTLPALWLWRKRWGGVPLAVGTLGLTVLIFGLTLCAPRLVAEVAPIYPGRWQVWERASYIICDHPFTGIGLDTFRVVAQTLYPYFDYAFNQSEHAHCLLLSIGVDQGITGMLAFMGLVVLFYRTNCAAWWVAESRTSKALALGLGGGFTAFMLSSTFDNGVIGGRAAPAFWFLLGLGVSQARLLGVDAALPSRLPQDRSRRRFILIGVGAAGLVLAVCALPILWHNLGNVARNRGLLGVDLDGRARAAYATSTIDYYERAGGWALRDQGRMLFLAYHPWEILSRVAGMPGGQDRQDVSAFLDAIVTRSSPAEAVADLELATMRYPGDRFAHLYLAEAYRAQERLGDAAVEYRRAGVPIEWLVAEARRRWDWGRGDTEGALTQLAIAISIAPQAAEAHDTLGLVYEQQGDYNSAAVAYRIAADLYRDRGMTTQARTAYERLLRIEPDNGYAQAELTKLQRGIP